MAKIRLYILTTIVGFALVACQDILTTESSYNKSLVEEGGKYKDQILPLSLGSYWKYSYYAFNESGEKVAEITEERFALRDTLMAGRRWYTLDSTGNAWMINKSDGLHSTTVLDSNKGKDFLVIKFPARVGDSFTNSAGNWTVISVDTLIEVKAGTFKCYAYKSEEKNTVNIYYYSPGYGFIKQATRITNSISHMYFTLVISELTDFSIK